MEDSRSVRMESEEVDAFLGNNGTGVISFGGGDDEPPYSRPVSYGYDAADGQFFFRLSFAPDSGGTDPVDPARPVSFVTYDETEDGWQSVVATGRLDAVDEADVDTDVLDSMRRVHIPLVDVFDRRPQELEFRFFRLAPDELTGKREAEIQQ